MQTDLGKSTTGPAGAAGTIRAIVLWAGVYVVVVLAGALALAATL